MGEEFDIVLTVFVLRENLGELSWATFSQTYCNHDTAIEETTLKKRIIPSSSSTHL
jgi:hypothetical protein